MLNLPSSCEVHSGCVAKLEPKGVGGELLRHSVTPTCSGSPGLASQPRRIENSGVMTSVVIIFVSSSFFSLFIVMDSFFLSYLPPQHHLCQAENPPTLQQASRGFRSHTCVEASPLLFSSPSEPPSSRVGPGGTLVLHRKAASLPSNKYRRLNPRKGQSAVAKACSRHRTSRE